MALHGIDQVPTGYWESLDTDAALLVIYPLSQWVQTEISLKRVWPLVHHLRRLCSGDGKRLLGDVYMNLSGTFAAAIDGVNVPMSS